MKSVDHELEKAQATNEKLQYYEVTYQSSMFVTHRYIKQYKPAVAELLSKRIGWKIKMI